MTSARYFFSRNNAAFASTMPCVSLPFTFLGTDCDAPPNVTNADVDVNGTDFLDWAVYQCHVGYAFNQSTNHTIDYTFCLGNDTWTPVDDCQS